MFVMLAACGAAPAPPAAGVRNDAPAPALEAKEWAAVREGMSFPLHDTNNRHLVAHVDRVEATPTTRTIRLSWQNAERERDTIVITATTVQFVERNQTFARAARPIGETELAESFPVLRDDGAVCYVVEDMPPDGAECPDVCEGDFCVDAKRGLVGGAGIGWPGRNIFQP